LIRTFKGKWSEKVFDRQPCRGLAHDFQRRAYIRLRILDAADSLTDLNIPPGNRLEKLSGDRKGKHSIRINNQWRICFIWRQGNAFEVEITDYH